MVSGCVSATWAQNSVFPTTPSAIANSREIKKRFFFSFVQPPNLSVSGNLGKRWYFLPNEFFLPCWNKDFTTFFSPRHQ